MNTEQLQQILKDHKQWISSDGHEGKRANLYDANLSGAYLSGAYLSGADLSSANLSRANLSGANLTGANLSHVKLLDANLTGADLTGADLTGADLSSVNLSRANLSRANLYDAILPFAIYQFFAGKHNAMATPTELRIGCEVRPWEDWLKEYKNIGKENGYTNLEIKQHLIMIKAMHKCIILAEDCK